MCIYCRDTDEIVPHAAPAVDYVLTPPPPGYVPPQATLTTTAPATTADGGSYTIDVNADGRGHRIDAPTWADLAHPSPAYLLGRIVAAENALQAQSQRIESLEVMVARLRAEAQASGEA